MAFANGPGIVACLPFPVTDSAQEFPGSSVGVLPLHMIEEETAGEDSDHARRRAAVHRVVDSSSVQSSTE